MAKKLTIDIETRVTRTREARAEIEKALSSVKADLKIRVDPKDADDKFAHLNSLVKGAEQAVVNYRKEIKATESAFVRAAARGGDHYTANMLQVDEMKARRKQAAAFMKETKALYDQVFFETYGKAIDLVVDTSTAKTAVEELRARIYTLREAGANVFSANVFRGKITGDLERQLDEVQSQADALKESLSHATDGTDLSGPKAELAELVAKAEELRRILAIDTVRDFYRQSGLHIGNDFGSIPVRHGGKDSDIDRAQRASILAHIIRPIFEQNDIYKRLEEQNADTAEYSKKLLTYWQKRGEVVEPGGDWGMMQDLLGPLAGGTPGVQPWQPFFAQMGEEWQRHQDDMADADRKRNGLPPADSAAEGYRNLRAQSRDIALHFGGGNRTVVDESTGKEVEDESEAHKESAKTIRNWTRIVQAGLGSVLMTDYALRKLGNNSKIVSTYYAAYGKIFGAIIDTALVPFLPALRTVLSAMTGILKMLRDTHGALGVFLRGLTLFAFTGLPLAMMGLLAKGMAPLLLQKLVTATLGKRAADFLFQNTTRGQLAGIQATLTGILTATGAGAGGGALDTATDIGMMAALGGRFGWLKKIPGLGRLFGGAGGTLTKAYRWLPKSVPIGAEGAGALAKIRNVLGGLLRLANIGRIVPVVTSALSWFGGALASVASAVISIPGLIGAAIGGVVVAAMYFTGILTAIADAGQGFRDWLHDVLGWSREGGLSGVVPAVKPVWESDKTYEAVKGVNDGTITTEQQFGNAIKPTHFAQGGAVTQTGLALIHTGETVVPAGRQPLAGAAGSNVGAVAGAAAGITKDAAAYTSAGQAADQYSLKTLRVISILKMLSVWLFRSEALLVSLSRPWIIPIGIITLGVAAGIGSLVDWLIDLWTSALKWISEHANLDWLINFALNLVGDLLTQLIKWLSDRWTEFNDALKNLGELGWLIGISLLIGLVDLLSQLKIWLDARWLEFLDALKNYGKLGWELVLSLLIGLFNGLAELKLWLGARWIEFLQAITDLGALGWKLLVELLIAIWQGLDAFKTWLNDRWLEFKDAMTGLGSLVWKIVIEAFFSGVEILSGLGSWLSGKLTEIIVAVGAAAGYVAWKIIIQGFFDGIEIPPGEPNKTTNDGRATLSRLVAALATSVPWAVSIVAALSLVGFTLKTLQDAWVKILEFVTVFGRIGWTVLVAVAFSWVADVVEAAKSFTDSMLDSAEWTKYRTLNVIVDTILQRGNTESELTGGTAPVGGGTPVSPGLPIGAPVTDPIRNPKPTTPVLPIGAPVTDPIRNPKPTTPALPIGTPVTDPIRNPKGPAMPPPVTPSGGFNGLNALTALFGVAIANIAWPIIKSLGSADLVANVLRGFGLAENMIGQFVSQMFSVGASAIPAMAVGGSVMSDGAAIIHKGETVVPADVQTPYSGGKGGGGGSTIMLNNPVFQFTGKDEKQMFDNFMRRMKQEGGRLK